MCATHVACGTYTVIVLLCHVSCGARFNLTVVVSLSLVHVGMGGMPSRMTEYELSCLSEHVMAYCTSCTCPEAFHCELHVCYIFNTLKHPLLSVFPRFRS